MPVPPVAMRIAALVVPVVEALYSTVTSRRANAWGLTYSRNRREQAWPYLARKRSPTTKLVAGLIPANFAANYRRPTMSNPRS